MSIDFSLLLVILTIISGLIWLIDARFVAPKRQDDNEGENPIENKDRPLLEGAWEQFVSFKAIAEFARFIFPVVLIVFLLRGFIAEPFRIPSGSMLPTLEIGDFILVSKFNYGIRVPVINKKVIETGSPEKGDVVVFRYPEDPRIDYIKRVVGVPGDEIGYYNKVLYINGKMAEQQPKGDYPFGGISFRRLEEKKPGSDEKHDIIVTDLAQASDFVLVVPENSYFVMGDNRDNSRDSRVWGFVPDKNLVGKAFFVWMSWEWGDWPKWHRIGTVID